MTARPQVAAVGAVFAAGVLLRLLFVIDYRPAFLGDPDVGSYVNAAHLGLFTNVYDPAGYPLFIRLVDFLYPHLLLLIVVQHLLGIATAALFYLAVRRVTGSRWLGLAPAALVLFHGYGVWVEHTPITETLFSFLVAAALYLALRLADGRRWLAFGVGAVVAAAAMVRPVGLTLILVIGVWMVRCGRGSFRARGLEAAILVGVTCLLIGGYVAIQRAQNGFTGITQDSGRVLYAQAARFAACSQFTAPTGTSALCEQIPAAKRGSFNQYLTGYPDKGGLTSAAARAISPAWRVFGPPPAGNAKLQAFGLQAIIHQPLDYLSVVVGDFHYYWSDHHVGFIAGDSVVDSGVQHVVSAYYVTGPGVHSENLGFLRWYGQNIEITGILMIVLLLAPLTALLIGDRRLRGAALLFACTGWLLPLAADAAASVDPRFALPAYGPLAAAAAIGLGKRRVRTVAAADASVAPPPGAGLPV